MRLADAHIHLTDKAFEGRLESVLEVARGTGLERFLSCATESSDWPALRQLAERVPGVTPAFGLHPWFIESQPEDWLAQLEDFLTAIPACLGEVGLDSVKAKGEVRQAQAEALKAQLALARKLQRPVILHTVRALGLFLDLVKEVGPLPGFSLHAFEGPPELIARAVKLGGYFSIGAAPLNPARLRAREAFLAVPLDRLLLETDAPWLIPPEEYRAFPLQDADGSIWNHPANLAPCAEGLAALRGLPVEEFTEAVWANFHRLLGGLQ